MQRLGRALPAHHERHEGKKTDIQVISLHASTSFFFFYQAVFPLHFLHTYPDILGYL